MERMLLDIYPSSLAAVKTIRSRYPSEYTSGPETRSGFLPLVVRKVSADAGQNSLNTRFNSYFEQDTARVQCDE